MKFHRFTMSERKAVVKNADMDPEMQAVAIEKATQDLQAKLGVA